jgi:phosphoribosylglycinamide formyltransferase-1
MRVLGSAFVRRFAGRLVNIHPSLLPAFPGLHGVRQALAAGVSVSGCTVHFVEEGVDSGPIVAQAAVPVFEDDTETTLSARIQREERRLYPSMVAQVCEERVRLVGRQAVRG